MVYKGVSEKYGGKSFHAQIWWKAKYLSLGNRATEEDAARLFDRAIYKLRGKKDGFNIGLTAEERAELDGVTEEEFLEGLKRENLRLKMKQEGWASKFRGVSWHSKGEKWQAHIRVDGRTKNLGIFSSEQEAAEAYDAALIERDGEGAATNARFFSGDLTGGRFSAVVPRGRGEASSRQASSPRRVSLSCTAYKGVAMGSGGSSFVARIRWKGKLVSLGCRGTDEEAARLYDRALYKLRGERDRFNIGLTAEERVELDGMTEEEFWEGLRRENFRLKMGKEGRTSKYRGVSWDKQNGKWKATITVGGRQRSLGLFSSDQEAAEAYDAALVKRDGEGAATNAWFFSGDLTGFGVAPVVRLKRAEASTGQAGGNEVQAVAVEDGGEQGTAGLQNVVVMRRGVKRRAPGSMGGVLQHGTTGSPASLLSPYSHSAPSASDGVDEEEGGGQEGLRPESKTPMAAKEGGAAMFGSVHGRRNWEARLTINGEETRLGPFSSKEEAAAACSAAILGSQGAVAILITQGVETQGSFANASARDATYHTRGLSGGVTGGGMRAAGESEPCREAADSLIVLSDSEEEQGDEEEGEEGEEEEEDEEEEEEKEEPRPTWGRLKRKGEAPCGGLLRVRGATHDAEGEGGKNAATGSEEGWVQGASRQVGKREAGETGPDGLYNQSREKLQAVICRGNMPAHLGSCNSGSEAPRAVSMQLREQEKENRKDWNAATGASSSVARNPLGELMQASVEQQASGHIRQPTDLSGVAPTAYERLVAEITQGREEEVRRNRADSDLWGEGGRREHTWEDFVRSMAEHMPLEDFVPQAASVAVLSETLQPAIPLSFSHEMEDVKMEH